MRLLKQSQASATAPGIDYKAYLSRFQGDGQSRSMMAARRERASNAARSGRRCAPPLMLAPGGTVDPPSAFAICRMMPPRKERLWSSRRR